MAASGHQARSTAVGTAEITARRLPAARGRARIEGPIRWDQWWVEPALVVLVLGAFIVYSTWAALPERPLLRGAVPLAVLLAVPVDGLPARHRAALREAPGAPDHRGRLAGVPDPLGARAVPADLLLLPEGVLPVVLRCAAGVRGDGRPPGRTRARRASRSSSRTSTATRSTWRCSSSSFLWLRRPPGVPVSGRAVRHRRRARSSCG